MLRPYEEVREATLKLQASLRAANTYVSSGRGDMGTKTALNVAFGLCSRLRRRWGTENI
jgi:hypothetical protein